MNKLTQDDFAGLDYQQSSNLVKRDFVNEKSFVDFIEFNIQFLVEELLNLEYHKHQREFKIEPFRFRVNAKHRRVDLFIETKCKQHFIVECKVPREGVYDISNAIGQLLYYGARFQFLNGYNANLVLLINGFDHFIVETIKRYNLPILYIAIDKENVLISSIEHLNSNETETNAI